MNSENYQLATLRRRMAEQGYLPLGQPRIHPGPWILLGMLIAFLIHLIHPLV